MASCVTELVNILANTCHCCCCCCFVFCSWQDDEDDLKDYKVNLGAYVVPEHEQKVIQQETAAAAAPAVVLTTQVTTVPKLYVPSQLLCTVHI